MSQINDNDQAAKEAAELLPDSNQPDIADYLDQHRPAVAERLRKRNEAIKCLETWKAEAQAMGDAALANWVLRVAEKDERIAALEAVLRRVRSGWALPEQAGKVIDAALAGGNKK